MAERSRDGLPALTELITSRGIRHTHVTGKKDSVTGQGDELREQTLLGDKAGLPSRYVTVLIVPFLGRFSVCR